MTILLNILTVEPSNQGRLLQMLRGNTDPVIRTLDGWISTTLIVRRTAVASSSILNGATPLPSRRCVPTLGWLPISQNSPLSLRSTRSMARSLTRARLDRLLGKGTEGPNQKSGPIL